PIVNPRNAFAIIETRIAKCTATRFLFEMKLFSAHVRDGEVRDFQIVHDEARHLWIALVRRTNSLPEKRQLVAETVSGRIEKIPGEVPPLSFKIGMRKMIARKFVLPAGLGR